MSVFRIALLVTAFIGPAALAWAQNSATVPVPRDGSWWMDRHNAMNEQVKQGNVDLLMIGDSITHMWELSGKEVWAQYYAKRNALNLGISGDTTQHVLWRLDNGNIEGIAPKLAVIMIGTNNCGANTPEEIAEGIVAIVDKLRAKLPEMKILLLAIFPRSEKPDENRTTLAKANELASKAADNKHVFYLDLADAFLDDDGTLPKDIMPDFLHPNEKGYQIWADAMEPKIKELLGE